MKLIQRINGINIDFGQMEEVCSTHEYDFMPIVQSVYPHAQFYTPTDGRQLIYVDNKAALLSVCHLDGTLPASHFFWGPDYDTDDVRVFSPFVDDRIGAYIQLYVYTQLGIKTDILFTEGEEQGKSTAMFFNQPNRRYNWMFEFDRMGTDVVHYQYTLKPWLKAVDKHFDGLNHGMFSDIGALDHLGCQGMNIGCGYHNYTEKYGWCSMKEMTVQCQRFLKFYNEFKDVPFHHDPELYSKRRRYSRYEEMDVPWSVNQLKPEFRSRKAKILNVRHVKKGTIQIKSKAELDAAVAEFQAKEVERNKQAETIVNTEVKKRLTAIAAKVDDLVEVEEPIRELVPEAPIPADTTPKLLTPGN